MSKYIRLLVVAFVVALLLGAVLTSVASAWGPSPWYPSWGGYYHPSYYGCGYPYWGGGYPYWGGGYPYWGYGYYSYSYCYSYPYWGGGWWW